MFDILVAKAMRRARYRRVFTTAELLLELHEQGVDVLDVGPGAPAYRAAIKRLWGTMSVPGTSLAGATADVFLWPRLRKWERARQRPVLDDDYVVEAGEAVDSGSLPEAPGSRTIIIAGAGVGKSALLCAIGLRNADSIYLPVLIPVAALARSGLPILTYLDREVATEFGVSIDWIEQCERGTLLLLFDGLDELPIGERTSVLTSATTFSARFPRVPWLLTARDAATLAAPTGDRILELQPLRDDEAEQFCQRWLPAAHQGKAKEIAVAISRSRELRRMARIPLLLSLMVDHALVENRPLPVRRAELLERYVRTLLRPEAHKPSVVLPNELVLRDAAERLAFAALEAGGTEVAARNAWHVLRGSPPTVLTGLKMCGLLREERDAYRFAFPLIQEYLAGCYIDEHLAEEIVRRFAEESSRPWAQALLFAVERSNKADTLVNKILELNDDAFGTMLITIGRCIANGAQVTLSTRTRVGDGLAVRWNAGQGGRAIGLLLADGYIRPLPSAARERLSRGDGLDDGGDEIIVAAEDDALTASALGSVLMRGFAGHVQGWQPAIDRIASRAATMYLERAARRISLRPDSEPMWIAYLLGELPPVSAQNDPRRAAAVDPNVEPLVRLAALMGLTQKLDGTALPLVEDALARFWAHETPSESPVFKLICDAIWRLPEPIAFWRLQLRRIELAKLEAKPGAWWLFDLSPQEAYWRQLLSAIVTRTPYDEALRHLRELDREERPQGTRRDFLQLTRAFIGDAEAFAELAERLPSLRRSDIAIWLMLSGRHDVDVVTHGVTRLETVGASERSELCAMLTIVLRHEVELHGLFGGLQVRARRLHQASSEGARVLRIWANEALPRSAERIDFLAGALQLADQSALIPLVQEFEARLGSAEALDLRTDSAMANAVGALADAGAAPNLQTLRRAILLSTANLANSARGQLVAAASPDALAVALELHAIARARRKSDLEGTVQFLSQRLGVRIERGPTGQLHQVDHCDSAKAQR